MNAAIRTAYQATVADYVAARQRGDLDAAFSALERAHVLSQRYLIAHMITHLRMFSVGFARKDGREVFGQLVRIIATVLGYVTGWVPLGNTGGANVSPLKPMPLSGDLEVLLRDYNPWRDVAWRVGIAALLVIASWTFATLNDRAGSTVALPNTNAGRSLNSLVLS